MLRKREKKISRVLVIEDDRIFCKIHGHIVKQTLNVQPEIFEKAKEAIEFLDSEEEREGQSLVLLDLNMPEVSGWEFLDIISEKAYRQEVFVVIITSSPFKEDYERSKNYEQVVAYLTKPLKKENFLELLKRENIIFKEKVSASSNN